jgi:hypothetical protein
MIYTNMPRLPRCPNGTRRNRRSKRCEPLGANGTRSRSPKRKTITNEEFNHILNSFPELSEVHRIKLEELRPRLLRMKYKKNYISCFTGMPTKNAVDMVHTRVSCWLKYGDDIM